MQAEGVPGGFAQAYRTLAGFEQAGHCRRGYLIEKLGAAQFAASATVDRLRQFAGLADPEPLQAMTLAATDPANPYGAALPWPAIEGVKHRPGRKAGGLVVLVDGSLVLYLERGGKSALAFTDHEARLAAATTSLAATSRQRRLDTITIEQVDGEFVYGTAFARALRDAGFVESPRGLTLRRQTARRPLDEPGDPRACLRATPSSAPRSACTRRSPGARSPGSTSACRAARRPTSAARSCTRSCRWASICCTASASTRCTRTSRWRASGTSTARADDGGSPRSRPARSSGTASGMRWASTSRWWRCFPTRDEARIIGHLGPDPLSEGWDPAEAARRLALDTRPAHVAVLDQRNVAGFGNEYANEMLFVRGILPTRPASEVDTRALVDLGARMIAANRDRAGRTFTGDSRPGRATWVYGRDGQPCRRCGTRIERGSLGASETSERNVFWCPHCQV